MKIITIGRTDNNDIVLKHEMISRLHAKLEIAEDGSMILRDMSANGTKVKGALIKNKAVSVLRGDPIRFADVLPLNWNLVHAEKKTSKKTEPQNSKTSFWKRSFLLILGVGLLSFCINAMIAKDTEETVEPNYEVMPTEVTDGGTSSLGTTIFKIKEKKAEEDRKKWEAEKAKMKLDARKAKERERKLKKAKEDAEAALKVKTDEIDRIEKAEKEKKERETEIAREKELERLKREADATARAAEVARAEREAVEKELEKEPATEKSPTEADAEEKVDYEALFYRYLKRIKGDRDILEERKKKLKGEAAEKKKQEIDDALYVAKEIEKDIKDVFNPRRKKFKKRVSLEDKKILRKDTELVISILEDALREF